MAAEGHQQVDAALRRSGKDALVGTVANRRAAEEGGELHLIGGEPVRDGEELWVNGRRWGRIEQGGDPRSTCRAEGRECRCLWNLKLANDDGWFEVTHRSLGNGGVRIVVGAGDDDDAVDPVRVDPDRRDAA